MSIGGSSARRFEPEVLVRRGVREALDAVDARLLHPRADAPEEGQFVDRHVHRAVLHDLLDLMEHGLALLPVELAGLTLEEALDLRDLPRGIDAALGRVDLDAGGRVAGGGAEAHDHPSDLVLSPRGEKRGALQGAQARADARRLEVVAD